MPAALPTSSPSGARIRALRRERGWTQVELAQRLGITQSIVSAIEIGGRRPGLPLAIAIAAALGVSVEDLFAEYATEAQP